MAKKHTLSKSDLLLFGIIMLFPVICFANPDKDKQNNDANKKGEEKMTLKITTPSFKNGEKIPVKFSGDGENVSPAVDWSDAPEKTVEFALICDDPDAPTAEPWVHWIVYAIPGNLKGLPEGKPSKSIPDSPPGIKEGRNSFGKTLYGGPAPPKGHGVHHYFFKVYALDKKITQPAGITKSALLKEMEGHILAKGELMGTYQR